MPYARRDSTEFRDVCRAAPSGERGVLHVGDAEVGAHRIIADTIAKRYCASGERDAAIGKVGVADGRAVPHTACYRPKRRDVATTAPRTESRVFNIADAEVAPHRIIADAAAEANAAPCEADGRVLQVSVCNRVAVPRSAGDCAYGVDVAAAAPRRKGRVLHVANREQGAQLRCRQFATQVHRRSGDLQPKVLHVLRRAADGCRERSVCVAERAKKCRAADVENTARHIDVRAAEIQQARVHGVCLNLVEGRGEQPIFKRGYACRYGRVALREHVLREREVQGFHLCRPPTFDVADLTNRDVWDMVNGYLRGAGHIAGLRRGVAERSPHSTQVEATATAATSNATSGHEAIRIEVAVGMDIAVCVDFKVHRIAEPYLLVRRQLHASGQR